MLLFGFSEKRSASGLPKERCLLSFNFTWEMIVVSLIERMGTLSSIHYTQGWKQNEAILQEVQGLQTPSWCPRVLRSGHEKVSPSVIITLENYVEKVSGFCF